MVVFVDLESEDDESPPSGRLASLRFDEQHRYMTHENDTAYEHLDRQSSHHETVQSGRRAAAALTCYPYAEQGVWSQDQVMANLSS